jgi:NAD(P)-dependent dehydrogenase (short-subunit alcohol dehydrogenase family)
MDFTLTGKAAIITGAAGSIGAWYARTLAQAGAAVVLADLDEQGARQRAQALTTEGLRASGVRVDITEPASVAAMVELTERELGGVDILVNDAALMSEVPRTRLSEFPLEWWDRVMDVNVRGALVCSQACVPSMRRRGGGKIINQSSGGAWVSATPYAVSKLALVGLTQGLARDLGADHINVNAIAPGTVLTEATERMFAHDDPFWEQRRALNVLHQIGEPDDLAGALLFFASPASDWTTGQCLNVDGGWVMRT